jgi:two-component system sensor histidine kinase EvgS
MRIMDMRLLFVEGLLCASPLLGAVAPLRSAVEPDYPPLSIVTAEGLADGFAVELLRTVLNEMGREVTFEVGPWAAIKQDLAAGKLDVLPLVGRTPERETLYDFTLPYLTLHGALFVRADTVDIRAWEDVKDKRVAVMRGDNAEEYIRRKGLARRIIMTGTFEEAFKVLSAGQADAVVAQKLMGLSLLKRMGFTNVRVVGKPNEEFSQNFCFAVRKGRQDLLSLLNEGLAIIMAKGINRHLERKWLGVSEKDAALARVVIYGGDSAFPPYEYLDADGRPSGFNIDLARAVAREIGVEITFQLAPWSETRSKLERGELDLSSMFYSASRAKMADFSVPHTLVYQAIFARNDSPPYHSLDDLKGRHVAVQDGDIMHDYALEHGLGASLTVTTNSEEALAQLAKGNVDYALGSHLQGLYWIKRNGWNNLHAVKKQLFGADYCYAIQKGNTALCGLFNEGLRQLNESGQYRTIYNKWLGVLETDLPWRRFVKTLAVLLAAAALLAALAVGIIALLRQQVLKRTSELKEANRELEDSRATAVSLIRDMALAQVNLQRTQFALDQTADAIFWVDSTGRLIYVNEAACRSLGYTRDELLRLSIKDIDPDFPSKRWPQHWLELKEKRLLTFETRHQTKDGRTFPVEIHASYLKSADKEYNFAFAHNITQRKRAEAEREQMLAEAKRARRALLSVLDDEKRMTSERNRLESQLLQAQKMEAVGRLAGGVAHDFNNLLMGIMGYTELCQEQIAPGHPIREYLDEIMSASHRSAEITRQLLAFASKQTIAPKVLDLNETVAGMLKLLRRLIGEDINLAWIPGANLRSVKLDPSQVDQLLANLCVNARDSIAGVGKITLETGNVVIDADYAATHAEAIPGAYVFLAVSDDGCGMDKETLAQVFEPFFTTKGIGKGTGLGLATVYGIVKQNSGFVYAYSEPGKGTTFKICLPQAAPEAAALTGEGQAETPRGQGETILLVEDEKALRFTCGRFMEALGYHVLAAEAPGEALRIAAGHQGTVDLLLTDVVMPGMDGRQLAQRLCKARPGLKVLFMSGYTSDVITQRGVLAEGVQFLSKPFSREALARKVREVLESRVRATLDLLTENTQ